jgi:hypothetical protein
MIFFILGFGMSMGLRIYVPSTGGPKGKSVCDEKAFKEAEVLWRKGDLGTLRTSACINPNEDLHDAHEFLGRQYQKQGPCTKQVAPSLFLIGYGHSGSTSFADALDRHPQLSYGSKKEHRYFCNVMNKTQSPKDYPDTWSEYLNEFNVSCDTTRTFDATPFYFEMGSNVANRCDNFHKHGIGAVQAFQDYIGSNAQIMVLIRDPIDWHCSKNPGSCEDFLVSNDLAKLIDPIGSCFANHLEPWMKVFSSSQVLFIKSEEFFQNQRATLSKVFQFAGVTDSIVEMPPVTSGRRRNSITSKITLEHRKAFHQMPSQLNCKRRLESLTGLKITWPGS